MNGSTSSSSRISIIIIYSNSSRAVVIVLIIIVLLLQRIIITTIIHYNRNNTNSRKNSKSTRILVNLSCQPSLRTQTITCFTSSCSQLNATSWRSFINPWTIILPKPLLCTLTCVTTEITARAVSTLAYFIS